MRLIRLGISHMEIRRVGASVGDIHRLGQMLVLLGIFWASQVVAQVNGPLGGSWEDLRIPQPYACFDCVDKETTRGRFHQGVDIRPCGRLRSDGHCDYPSEATTHVLAVADGEVCNVIVNGVGDNGFGNAVIVRHDALDVNGGVIYSLYAHMKDSAPERLGDKVDAGDPIGEMGGSGSGLPNKYEPHLHFALMRAAGAGGSGVTEEPLESSDGTVSKCSFSGNGYSEQHPLLSGFVDPWRFFLPLPQPIVVEVSADTTQGPLRVRDGPGAFNGSTLSVVQGQRFVAYAATRNRSWYLVDVPCGRGAGQFASGTNRSCSGWLRKSHTSCVPSGDCIQERPEIPTRSVSFATASGINVRSGPGTAFLSSAKIWESQAFVTRSMRWASSDLPDAHCNGPWYGVDVPRELAVDASHVQSWVCSKYLLSKQLSQGGCAKVQSAFGQTALVPPCPFIDEPGLISECFTMPRAATADETIELYESPGSRRVVARVHRGDAVRGVAYQLWTVGCPVRTVRGGEAYGPGPNPPILVGPNEVLLYLKHIGEGSGRFWLQGIVVQAEDNGCDLASRTDGDCWFRELTSCEGDEDSYWGSDAVPWVQIETSSGVRGWTAEMVGLEWEERC